MQSSGRVHSDLKHQPIQTSHFTRPAGLPAAAARHASFPPFPPLVSKRESPIALAPDLGFGMTHQRVIMESDRGL
jgi:hypothetical protein